MIGWRSDTKHGVGVVAVSLLLSACGSSSTTTTSPARDAPSLTPSPTPVVSPAATPPAPTPPIATPPPRASVPLTGGIRGIAEAGPTCPVQRIGAPPCTTPVVADIRVAEGAKQVAEVMSRSDGSFVVSLPPGTYVLTGTWATAGRAVVSRSASVVVTAGVIANVTVEFDTGIR